MTTPARRGGADAAAAPPAAPGPRRPPPCPADQIDDTPRGAAVDSWTTSATSSTSWTGSVDGFFIWDMSRSTAPRAIASIGCWMTVSGGLVCGASSVPSKDTRETSAGTERPSLRQAESAPVAWTSEDTNRAVTSGSARRSEAAR
ncbi:hypothetical protein DEH69_25740 [Streptomyces sp. PT12]|nr:hypothetical protein DEH69_25740 [Streptomyces sp. PT12]